MPNTDEQFLSMSVTTFGRTPGAGFIFDSSRKEPKTKANV
jgi:hypothetical protein